MIVWLDKALALAIHDRLLAEHGGSSGVRDAGLLESALARPRQLDDYEGSIPDLADPAARLAHGIAENHLFVFCNKCAAYTCCETFLMLNGAELEAEASDKYLTVLMLAEGKLKPEDFAAWLRAHIPPIKPAHSIQEPRKTYRRRKTARVSS